MKATQKEQLLVANGQMPFAPLAAGKDGMDRAKAFKAQYPWAYNLMVQQAQRDYQDTGRTSAKWLIEVARRQFRIHISNTLTPYFARLICEEYPHLKNAFTFNRSKADIC